MRIDLLRPDAWDIVCDQYRTVLPFQDPNLQIQVYMGYRHAVWESAWALARLFSHKRTIAIVKTAEPVFESLAMAFSSEGYSVVSLNPSDLREPSTWLAGIETDLLFVLWADDDPVTGRVHRYPEMQAALKDRRLFRIRLSHAQFAYEKLERPMPFEVRLLSLSAERALLVAGERCRIRPPLADLMPWRPEPSPEGVSRVSFLSDAEIESRQRAILAFESDLPSGFKPYFSAGEERVWDRAVIYQEKYDGWAVVSELGQALSEEIDGPGYASNFDTFSPCRWESPRLAEGRQVVGDDPSKTRGLIVLSSQLLGAQLKKELEKVAQKIDRIQEGDSDSDSGLR